MACKVDFSPSGNMGLKPYTEALEQFFVLENLDI